jgi:thioesterase domain-containing protein/acyl carrier protein
MDVFDKKIRDSTEMVIHEMWSQSLGSSDFTTQDNFFEIGATSIAALSVLALVRERFGVDLPLSAIGSFPTVEKLAQYLRVGGDLPIRSYIPIRQGLNQTLALIHPIGGSIIWFCDLIDKLPGNMSMVGLQAIALDPRATPHQEIDLMAKDYLAELLQEHRPGDLMLVGYSFGGLVAYEMARQLLRQGEPPSAVVLLDTIVPSPRDAQLSKSELLAKLCQSALNLKVDIDLLASLPENQLCDEILKVSRAAGALPPDYDRQRLQRLMDVYQIHAAAASRYKLPRYSGPVHLVQSRDAEPAPESDDVWRERCDHLIFRRLGTGNHASIISGDNALPVAAYLQDLWLSQSKPDQVKGGVS